VTVPYKELVIPLLDGLSELAADIGAVNTIVKQGSKLIGHNTDAVGFLRALTDEGKFDLSKKKIVMIGAGGVARAIGFILLKSGISSLAIFDIDQDRATKLALDLKSNLVNVLTSNEGRQYNQAVLGADLIVNCTPVGMIHTASEGKSPVPAELISPDSTVYDVVYNPPVTQLMSEARDAGATALGGLSMLVFQGVAAFELWTGKDAPVDIMMNAAQKVM
ncbi:MAG: shikimate dehydrogenase, partial [Desulfatiglandales bacterium]|nr:shikimate dehydrogenase [Desulfatiglandales bacterium]